MWISIPFPLRWDLREDEDEMVLGFGADEDEEDADLRATASERPPIPPPLEWEVTMTK